MTPVHLTALSDPQQPPAALVATQHPHSTQGTSASQNHPHSAWGEQHRGNTRPRAEGGRDGECSASVSSTEHRTQHSV